MEEVARGLVNKGLALGELNRSEEAIAVYDEIFERFGGSDQLELLKQVARALFNKGVALGELNRSEEAIAVYDKIFERFGGSDQSHLMEEVACALFNKGLRLGISSKPAEAIAAFESALRIQPNYPPALGARIEALVYLSREDEALRSLDEMLKTVHTSDRTRILIASRLLNSFIRDENRVRQVISLYADDIDSMIGGLILWVQNQIPLSGSDADELEVADRTLQSVFAEIAEATHALQMFNAVRRDSLGDRKALLSLPIELRRLVESGSEVLF